MKRFFPLLLMGSLLTTLAACDYRDGPGKNMQFGRDFTDAPKARATETNLDSMSRRQNVQPPSGKGSAADQKTSANAGLEGAPNNASSPVSTMPTNSAEGQAAARNN